MAIMGNWIIILVWINRNLNIHKYGDMHTAGDGTSTSNDSFP